jgi:hypothetical protein
VHPPQHAVRAAGEAPLNGEFILHCSMNAGPKRPLFKPFGRIVQQLCNTFAQLSHGKPGLNYLTALSMYKDGDHKS